MKKELLCALALIYISMQPSYGSEKKGLAIVPHSVINDTYSNSINAIAPSWYYNWGVFKERNVSENIPFVPMIGNLKSVKLINKVNSSRYLLLFNEPDNKINLIDSKSASLLTEEIASQLKDTTLISPASQNPWLPWMGHYFSQNKSNISILAVHWYGPPDIKKFIHDMNYLQRRYNKNIWLTEFAVVQKCSISEREKINSTEKFMEKALIFLNKAKYIERYSWFSPRSKGSNGCDLDSNMLITSDGKLTSLGKIYARY